MEYVYDSYGQRTELHTFRGGQNWSASLWPSSTTGTADITKWIYQESTGLLTQKQDAALKGPVYTYDELSRVKTRIWARGITCTYAYDQNTGELLTIMYSDSTPAVTFSYDRGGRQKTATDAAGSHTRTFNANGELQTEQISGGILDGVGITLGYDGFLRRNSLQTSQGANTIASQTYGYDANSRLQSVTSGGQTATYAYYTNSGLLNTTTFTGGTNIARSYDSFGSLQNITTSPSADAAQSYTYSYNNLNQRTTVTREDGSYWSYLYNDRGELKSGKKYWSDNSIVWGAQTEYDFDNMGNQKYARNGGNQINSLRQSNYTVNNLNQYSQRSVPSGVDVTGTANSGAAVSVNNQSVVRKGNYFYKELGIDNTTAPAYTQIDVVGAKNSFGPNGEDAVSTKGGHVFVPAAIETFTHDDDGNLTSDGRWNYSWDAENRLISMEAKPTVPMEAKSKLEFSYDCLGRRIRKYSYTWNQSTFSYQLQSVLTFVYDHWNLIAERDGSNTLIRSYVWGQDISGTLDGADGSAGLLQVNQAGLAYLAGYDGSENVTSLINSNDGKITSQYEFDPFGVTVKTIGTVIPIRFGSKYTDPESGLVYFGYRFYVPQIGRWLSRDPIAPDNGINLYSYVVNAPTNFSDFDGLQGREKGFRRVKRKEYVKSSPNWDAASGSLDRTYHAMILCVPKLSMDEAISRMFEELTRFTYFEPNIARYQPVGADRAHFEINDPSTRGTMELGGYSIDVILYTRSAEKQLLAVTTGDHPLVGVRMWRVEKAGFTADRKSVMRVVTEAYDQANTWLGDWGRYQTGRDQQIIMWTKYLSNIEAGWGKRYGATRIGAIDKFLHPNQSLPNPFRSLLPPKLQQSEYREIEEIIY